MPPIRIDQHLLLFLLCIWTAFLTLSAAAESQSVFNPSPHSKLSPYLHSLVAKGSKEQIPVTLFLEAPSDVGKFLKRLSETSISGVRMVRGLVYAGDLPELAQQPGVAAIIGAEPGDIPHPPGLDLGHKGPAGVSRDHFSKALKNAPAHEEVRRKTPTTKEKSAHKSWFGNDLLGVHDAWSQGIDGTGIKIAFIDSGIDFAHPDLQGTQARVEDPTSPYFGWPICFDGWSMLEYALYQRFASNWYADTSATPAVTTQDALSTAVFNIINNGTPESHLFTFQTESVSGVYHFGLHPDNSPPRDVLNGITPAILVVDHPVIANRGPGYNTVYVDLDADFDFTDEKPCFRGDEISYRDVWDSEANMAGADGYADVSGGMIYFIADGIRPIPASDWLYNAAPPAAGNLVAFMLDDSARSGGRHGTFVSSAAVGQGVINGDPPPIKPPYSGPGNGVVQGPGKGAKLIAIGNKLLGGFETDFHLFSSLGYDGVPNTGDEAQVVNKSYIYFSEEEVWDVYGRFIDWLNRTVAPKITWVQGMGNSGPGYTTTFSPASSNGIQVGASTLYDTGNIYDSIESVTQITAGEVTSFSSSGPMSNGQQGVHVVAHGARATGDVPINTVRDGWKAWQSVSGTSRATAEVSGIAALVYQAYRQTNGTFPDAETVRKILMNSATDLNYDVFRQGAGRIHAGRAADLASEQEGIRVTPPFLIGGDYRGAKLSAYASIVHRGDVFMHTFQVANTGPSEVNLQIADNRLQEFAHTEFAIDTVASVSETYDARRPHYLHLFQGAGANSIPLETDLMVVEAIYPFEDFDTDFVPGNPATLTPPGENQYALLVYNWADRDGDGKLVDDTLGTVPGLIESNEIDSGEYMRFDVGFVRGTTLKVSVSKPLSKMDDGIWIGIQKFMGPAEGFATRIRLRVRFFREVDCSWLSTNTTTLSIPADATATFETNIQVPQDQPYGSHPAKIILTPMEPGKGNSIGDTTVLPVSINVAADLSAGSFSISAATEAAEPYNNGQLYGDGSWDNPQVLGDGRMFFVNAQNPPEGSFLVTRTSWSDPTPSDIDTLILGPVSDFFSDPTSSFYHPDFGPNTLAPISGIRGFDVNRPFGTTSGGAMDYVTTPLREGLHGLFLQSILHSGKRFSLPFTVESGTFSVSPNPLAFETTASHLVETVTITSALDIPDFTVGAYGPSQYSVFYEDQEITPDFEYHWTFTVSNCAFLSLDQTSSGGFLYLALSRDGADGSLPDGIFTGVERVRLSNNAGLEQHVELLFPPDGQYRATVGHTSYSDRNRFFTLTGVTVQGQSVSVTNTLPMDLLPNSPTPIQIETTFSALQKYGILLLMGPSSSPNAIPLLVPATYYQPGDADYSGVVDDRDLLRLSELWQSAGDIPPALDFNHDGTLDASDLTGFLGLAE